MSKKTNQQAAEKRKREEALLTLEPFPAPYSTMPPIRIEPWSGNPPRIWIGTGDAGEPNE